MSIKLKEMNGKTSILVLFLVVMIYSAFAWFDSGTHERYVEHVETQEIELENYRIHIVSEYPSDGYIESYIHNDGKRDIVLKAGNLEGMINTCKNLHQASITEYSSPCRELKSRIIGS